MPGKVFVSYSQQDEEWKNRVVQHLKVLSCEGLEVWSDDDIAPGDDWLPAIETAMADCQVALMLISSGFLTTDFINRVEVQRLMERRKLEGLHVIPVILKPCAWDHLGWLSPINARPKKGAPLSGMNDHEADVALTELTRHVAGVLRVGKRPFDFGGSSSRPLSPKVDLDHLPRAIPDFLGRSAELGALDAAWDDVSGTSVFVIVAPGGTGKTSLIQRWLTKLNQPRHGWSRSVLQMLDRLRNRTGLECAAWDCRPGAAG